MGVLAAECRRAAAAADALRAALEGGCLFGAEDRLACGEPAAAEWVLGCAAAEHVRRVRYCARHDEVTRRRAAGGAAFWCGQCPADAVPLSRAWLGPGLVG
jgi:hypothetical protein